MENVKLTINKITKDPSQLDYFKIEGNFNYNLTVEISGKVPFSQSNIQIQSFLNAKNIPVPLNIKWYRKKNDDLQEIDTNGNLYFLTILEENCQIYCKITPVEEGQYGECRLLYGPIKISPAIRVKSNEIQMKNYAEFEVKGFANNGQDAFDIFEFDKGWLKASNHQYQIIYQIKIDSELAIKPVMSDPYKIKIFHQKSKKQEFFMKMMSVEDKEILHYFLYDKLRNMKQVILKEDNHPQKQESLIENSFHSVHKMMSQNNPLKVNINKKIPSRSQSQKGLFEEKFNIYEKIPNKLIEDSIVNKYLQGNYFKPAVSQVDQNKYIDQYEKNKSISPIKHNQQHYQNIYSPLNNEIHQQKPKLENELHRMKVTNQGLLRQVEMLQKHNQQQTKEQNFLTNEKDITLQQQFQMMNEKYIEIKKINFQQDITIQNLRQQLSKIQKEYESVENDKLNFQYIVKENEENKKQILEENDYLKKKLNFINDQNQELIQKQREITRLNEDLEQKENIIEGMVLEVEEEQRRSENVKQAYNDIKLEIQERERKLIQLEEDLEVQKEQIKNHEELKMNLLEKINQLSQQLYQKNEYVNQNESIHTQVQRGQQSND